MTIAIHQPNYLPWLGYFYKIYASDVFVFHDAVEFSKASYTKRCKIQKEKSSTDTTWLSVPVQQHKEGTPISNILISESNNWHLRHFRKIENAYAAAAYFDQYADWLKNLLVQGYAMRSLATMNIYLIKEIAHKLTLNNRYYRSSEMMLSGKGTALNLIIAQQMGATKYLAGAGSRNYQDDEAFHEAGIETLQHDLGAWLNAHPYDQGTGGFSGGLSVIDALMHIGGEGIMKMFERFQAEQTA